MRNKLLLGHDCRRRYGRATSEGKGPPLRPYRIFSEANKPKVEKKKREKQHSK